MIDLAEFAGTFGVEVDDKTAAKIVLDFDHMADHIAISPSDDLLAKFTQLLVVFESSSISRGK